MKTIFTAIIAAVAITFAFSATDANAGSKSGGSCYSKKCQKKWKVLVKVRGHYCIKYHGTSYKTASYVAAKYRYQGYHVVFH